MHPHAELIQTFYRAFQRRDPEGMAACYHPEVRFSDPVFPDLAGEAAGDMWRMLCAGATDLRIEFRDIVADDAAGRAHWEAWYPFSRTGRRVHNVIDAEFAFRDGHIVRHVDRFDLHRWAGQALGLPGKLLGGTSFLQNRLRAMAGARLEEFRARR